MTPEPDYSDLQYAILAAVVDSLAMPIVLFVLEVDSMPSADGLKVHLMEAHNVPGDHLVSLVRIGQDDGYTEGRVYGMLHKALHENSKRIAEAARNMN